MSLHELMESKGWKNFMAKLYGLGAAVVIVGALFKIMHWPGAGPMLVVGLSTEAIIFIFSAFEPLHEELDWTLVYPQLAGLDEDSAAAVSSGKNNGNAEEQSKVNKELLEAIKNIQPQSDSNTLAKFDKLVKDAKMGPELFKKLGDGLNNLSDSTNKLGKLSNASVATEEFVASTKTAAKSLNTLSDTNKKASEAINSSVGQMAGAYKTNAQVIKKSGDDLASSYHVLIDSMSIDFSSLTNSNNSYSTQLETINKNLSALNAVYELQLQSTNDSLKKSQDFYGSLDKMMGNVKDSSQESENYRKQVSNLSKKMVALNTVYGNMLSAMNVKMGS